MLIIALILFIILSIICLKIYKQISCCVCKCSTDLSGKTVVITGGNRGIGREIARRLALRNGRVIIGCRNVKVAQNTVSELKSGANLDIVAKHLDLSSLDSIRNFAKDINENESNVSVLICNAAVIPLRGRRLTVDGLEEQFCVNHLGHFLLVNLLMNKLMASGPSRVIVMTSILHHLGRIDFDNLNMEQSIIEPYQVYWNTKLANMLFVRELAKRIPPSAGVTVNACHPGLVRTDISSSLWYWNNILRPIVYPFLAKTLSEGAHTAVHLTLAPTLQSVTGKYFSDCRQTKPSFKCMDDKTAKRLWEVSEELTGAKFTIDRDFW